MSTGIARGCCQVYDTKSTRKIAPNTAPAVDKVKWKGVSAGIARGCCQAYDTGSVHFVPSVEVKMSYMSVG